MELIIVTEKEEGDFLKVPLYIYQKDPHYIRPLNKDVTDVFDPIKNKTFRWGECARWILADENGQHIGRIAAFVNRKYKNKGDEQRTGGIGFFECTRNQAAADTLFDVAKSWLMKRGMEAMDGPINFGERDRWWGLLVKGFKPPIYLMNYNLPYYHELFETYGFKKFYNQVCWHLDINTTLSDRFIEQHDKHAANPDLTVTRINKNNLKKFAADFSIIYNKAWVKHEGNKEMRYDTALKMLKSMKPIIDEDLMWFTYSNGNPIAMWINLPEMNQIVQHLNGSFNLFARLKYLWLKKKGVCNKFTGIVFGVVPEFQGKGIDYYMIVEGANVIKKKNQYTELELQWQGDFNPKMLNISKNLGATESRLLTTYRYLFDRSIEFKRHPFLD
ncbi:MAG: hypothetical protein ABJA57_08760 [Ginsengibacter sp.]